MRAVFGLKGKKKIITITPRSELLLRHQSCLLVLRPFWPLLAWHQAEPAECGGSEKACQPPLLHS